eukprot:5009113-Prorocentrum_lima.AAC.1
MVQKGGSSTRLIKGVLRLYCMYCMGQYFAGNQYLFVDVTKTYTAQQEKGRLKPKMYRQYSSKEFLVNQLSAEESKHLKEGPEGKH